MILDTCALLWLASGSTRLSRSTLRRITAAPVLCVSVISAFEVAHKEAQGKLDLRSPANDWFAQVVKHHGISVLALNLDDCIKAAQLPRIHDDPCDRFIIAVAKQNEFTVVTDDERFAEYGVDVLRGR